MIRFQSIALVVAFMIALAVACTPTTKPVESPVASVSLETEEEAREFGAAFANRALVGKSFPDIDGNPIPARKVTAKDWRVVKKMDGRWILKCDPPTSWNFAVSFNADGTAAKLDRAYLSLE